MASHSRNAPKILEIASSLYLLMTVFEYKLLRRCGERNESKLFGCCKGAETYPRKTQVTYDNRFVNFRNELLNETRRNALILLFRSYVLVLAGLFSIKMWLRFCYLLLLLHYLRPTRKHTCKNTVKYVTLLYEQKSNHQLVS